VTTAMPKTTLFKMLAFNGSLISSTTCNDNPAITSVAIERQGVGQLLCARKFASCTFLLVHVPPKRNLSYSYMWPELLTNVETNSEAFPSTSASPRSSFMFEECGKSHI